MPTLAADSLASGRAGRTGGAATSGGGTVTTQSLDGAITRCEFYDSTPFDVRHRAVFLGAYNSPVGVGRTVDSWGTGFGSAARPRSTSSVSPAGI